MPLVVLCGCPGSGKTATASLVCAALERRGWRVLPLHDAPTDYADAETEKRSRAALLSCVERALSRDVVVVIDGCCYLRSLRYQLHCVAKSLATPSCVVWCVGGDEAGELGRRFEPPSERNRWDRPLIMARPALGGSGVDWDEEALLRAVDGAPEAPPNLSTVAERPLLLHDRDAELNACVAELMARQKEGTGQLARHVTLTELRLWKREFLQLIDLSESRPAVDCREAFVKYVRVKLSEG